MTSFDSCLPPVATRWFLTHLSAQAEAVITEDNLLLAFETVGLFCELLVARMGLLDSEATCPVDALEAAASVIYCAQRVDVQEFVQVANLLALKFGKDWAKRCVVSCRAPRAFGVFLVTPLLFRCRCP